MWRASGDCAMRTRQCLRSLCPALMTMYRPPRALLLLCLCHVLYFRASLDGPLQQSPPISCSPCPPFSCRAVHVARPKLA